MIPVTSHLPLTFETKGNANSRIKSTTKRFRPMELAKGLIIGTLISLAIAAFAALITR